YTCNSGIEEKNSNQRFDSYFIAIDGIIKDYQKNINLKSVADDLHLSTKQASRIIKKYYKTTLSQLVVKKRLGVACALLENSDMAVSDIVKHINFPSESYFYSQFKKAYETTPLQYRKSKKQQPR
ncbi:MAG: helix-turn-helix domain-containing protein, partial [Monoglobaceae bacterium]